MEAESRQGACWRCGAETRGALVCPGCEAVQPVRADLDYFAALGLPRRLALDVADLERRYHEASRALHPDRFQTATPREQELSLAASALVNRARRTLRSPVARGRYWLELHDDRLGEDNKRVPPAIAAEVFETQEKLEELRAAGSGPAAEGLRAEVRALHDELALRLHAQTDELDARYAAWNGDGDLGELKRRLSEIAYLNTLLGDLEVALGGEETRGTDRRH
jgi:molecular chaperone HscB